MLRDEAVVQAVCLDERLKQGCHQFGTRRGVASADIRRRAIHPKSRYRNLKLGGEPIAPGDLEAEPAGIGSPDLR